MRHLHAVLVGSARRLASFAPRPCASIDILPFQLEPALALISGRASRFLLADEVGLGKTIQAGLMIAELQQRGWCERALIVTPAGLRRQWADELKRRFEMHAAVVDAAALSALTSVSATRRESLDDRTGVHHLDRLHQTARGPSRVMPSALGHSDRRRGASGVGCITSSRGRQERSPTARAMSSCLQRRHTQAMTPHTGRSANLGRARSRRSHSPLSTHPAAGGPAANAARPSASRAGFRRKRWRCIALLAAYVARLWRIAQETGRRDAAARRDGAEQARLFERALTGRVDRTTARRDLGSAADRRTVGAFRSMPMPTPPMRRLTRSLRHSIGRDEEEAALRQLLGRRDTCTGR